MVVKSAALSVQKMADPTEPSKAADWAASTAVVMAESLADLKEVLMAVQWVLRTAVTKAVSWGVETAGI